MRANPTVALSTSRSKVISFALVFIFVLPSTGCVFGDSGPFGDSDSGLSLEDYVIDLRGTYDVLYHLNENLSTCGEQIAPYTVRAVATAEVFSGQIRLNFQFPDAPVGIIGFYDENDRDYTGNTTPVQIQGNQYAQEYWMTDFQFGNKGATMFSGTSEVDFGSLSNDGQSVTEDCQRYFDISGVRLDF